MSFYTKTALLKECSFRSMILNILYKTMRERERERGGGVENYKVAASGVRRLLLKYGCISNVARRYIV
jgi:hypothetical protein